MPIIFPWCRNVAGFHKVTLPRRAAADFRGYTIDEITEVSLGGKTYAKLSANLEVCSKKQRIFTAGRWERIILSVFLPSMRPFAK